MERHGVEELAPFAYGEGLGRRTGLDLPGELTGVYPDRDWRARTFPHSRQDQGWSRGKDYHLAIGQGYMSATPLQTACLMATIANGGRAITPRLWLDGEAPAAQPVVFQEGALAPVRQGLEECVNCDTPGARGTAYVAFHGAGELPIRVAGKTGTADWSTRPDADPHAWFAGYAPVERPRVAFCVFIENGGHGGASAAPVAYRVLKEVYGAGGDAASLRRAAPRHEGDRHVGDRIER